MNTEGDYAESKYLRWHRWGSLGVAIAGIAVFSGKFGLGGAIRMNAIVVLPLALIWFAERLGGWGIVQSGYWLNERNADVGVRVMGWLILAAMIALRAFLYL
ncbi:MAG: hypothetical protein J0M04_10015 [Verrucomicrobia bacterium]|nr:hypothetical protein [Verrucomicrobiota bacterium]